MSPPTPGRFCRPAPVPPSVSTNHPGRICQAPDDISRRHYEPTTTTSNQHRGLTSIAPAIDPSPSSSPRTLLEKAILQTMPTPESEAFLAKKPTVPPTYEGVDFEDNVAVHNARDAIIREQWVRSMMSRLVGEELAKCYAREGVNHLEKCGKLRGEFFFALALEIYLPAGFFSPAGIGRDGREDLESWKPWHGRT